MEAKPHTEPSSEANQIMKRLERVSLALSDLDIYPESIGALIVRSPEEYLLLVEFRNLRQKNMKNAAARVLPDLVASEEKKNPNFV